MEEIIRNKEYRLYILDGREACCSDVPQHIVVERDACLQMVILVMPGVSSDVKLDVRLAGEGAEANIYGAYVCGGEERVKISVDMHHDLLQSYRRRYFESGLLCKDNSGSGCSEHGGLSGKS